MATTLFLIEIQILPTMSRPPHGCNTSMEMTKWSIKRSLQNVVDKNWTNSAPTPQNRWMKALSHTPLPYRDTWENPFHPYAWHCKGYFPQRTDWESHRPLWNNTLHALPTYAKLYCQHARRHHMLLHILRLLVWSSLGHLIRIWHQASQSAHSLYRIALRKSSSL